MKSKVCRVIDNLFRYFSCVDMEYLCMNHWITKTQFYQKTKMVRLPKLSLLIFWRPFLFPKNKNLRVDIIHAISK